MANAIPRKRKTNRYASIRTQKGTFAHSNAATAPSASAAAPTTPDDAPCAAAAPVNAALDADAMLDGEKVPLVVVMKPPVEAAAAMVGDAGAAVIRLATLAPAYGEEEEADAYPAPALAGAAEEEAEEEEGDQGVDEASGADDWSEQGRQYGRKRANDSSAAGAAARATRKRRCLLTGAELGGTTLPELETDQPAGRPGTLVAAALTEVKVLAWLTQG